MDKGGDGTMRANGNGSPNVCASNLLRLIRGEVPYGAEQYAIGATL